MEYEGRHADARKHISKIGLAQDTIEVQGRARTCVEPLARHEPVDELVVRAWIGEASLLLEVVALAPALTNLSEPLVPRVRFEPIRIVLRLHRARGCVDENERPRAFRIRRREHRTGLATAAGPHKHRTFRSDRVENRTNVVHTRLEASQVAWAVREAGSTLVEHDQARE